MQFMTCSLLPNIVKSVILEFPNSASVAVVCVQIKLAMVLTKSIRVWRKYRPRSVLMESKELLDQALLFESNAIAILCEWELSTVYLHVYSLRIYVYRNELAYKWLNI